MQDIIRGLTILFKYYPTASLGAEHDQIFVYGWAEDISVSKEDTEKLNRAGWFTDDDGDWTSYC